MPKGPLRLAIEDMVFTNANPSGGPGYLDRVHARWNSYWAKVTETNPGIGPGRVLFILFHIPGSLIYAIFGVGELIDVLDRLKAGETTKDVATALQDLLRSTIESSEVQAMAGLFGDEITQPIKDLFFEYAGRDDVDPIEFVDKMEGFLSVINASAAVVDIVSETLSLGQLESVGASLTRLYRNLGVETLQELSWRPFVTHALHPTFDRFYRGKYRPTRFSASDLRDLYALGEFSQEDLRKNAILEGWRDQDIALWIKLAFRKISEGDIWNAYHEGYISEEEATKRLRGLGYDPVDIPLLFKLNPKKETGETKAFTVSTARNAFKDNLIGEDELRTILGGLKYQSREIDLIVSIDRLSKQQKDRSLSSGQIKEAWTNNILTDQEAGHWLGEAGFGADLAGIILSSWKAEIAPTFKQLNLGTLTGAYIEGILNRAQTLEKLQGIGFSLDDATLQLNLIEARNPEAFGKPAPKQTKAITAGTLDNLVYIGLITPLQMQDRLESLGYSADDAALLAEAARIRAIPSARQLSQGTIQEGYFAGLLTRQDATQRLLDLGFTSKDAGLLLDLVDRDIKAAGEAIEQQQLKKLSAGSMQQLVIVGLLTGEEMHARLLATGYSQSDADLLTGRAVSLASQPARVLNQNNILSAYLVGVLDQTATLGKLTGLGFSPEDAATLVVTFENQHPEVFNPGFTQATRLPSIGALVSALNKGIISEDQYFQKTALLGYTPDDAKLYLSIAITAPAKAARDLTPSQLVNLYGAGFLDYATTLQRLTGNGYSEADAVLLIRLEKDVIQNSDVWVSLLSGQIDPFDAIAQLVNARYSDKDILDAFSTLGPSTLSSMGISIQELADTLGAIPGGA